MSWREQTDEAHRQAVGAAGAGLSDAAMGALRLTGPGVPALADAAVTSATPFLRAPVLARIGAALLLHPEVDEGGRACCPTCRTPSPCATRAALTL